MSEDAKTGNGVPPAAPQGVIRETDETARLLARRLLRGARHAALGFVDPADGFPSVSRVLVATDIDGMPVVLVSALSAHTRGLAADPRASLLFGEPGKGDPLAHPRLTVHCRAESVEREGADHRRLRRRFLARHPKAELYIDFPDFRMIRLVADNASLNGGFGRAYRLSGEELAIRSPASADVAEMEDGALSHMNSDHADAIALYATRLEGEKPGKWRMSGLDAAGFELATGDRLCRIEFDEPLGAAAQLRPVLVEMAKRARALA